MASTTWFQCIPTTADFRIGTLTGSPCSLLGVWRAACRSTGASPQAQQTPERPSWPWIACWTKRSLARPEIADLVVATLLDGQDVHHLYILHALVVMPNHVHLLITPKAPVPKLMQALKGPTARRANQILKRTGTAFWQEESYDHWVRNEREFGRIRAYIKENPVRAGWVAVAQDYRWSSAWLTAQTEPGQSSVAD